MHFWKMEASGNDFVMIRAEKNRNYATLALEVCHRPFGIGADGLLVVESKPLAMRLYNADGSEAAMCGNGLRCVAYLAHLLNLTNNDKMGIETKAGTYFVVRDKGLYYAHMGKTEVGTSNIVTIGNKEINLYIVEMGVKHAIVVNQELTQEEVEQLYERMECNLDFVIYDSKQQFSLVTYERGVGWTWGCGSGVCAAYAVGRAYYDLEENVLVIQRGGEVLVSEEEENIILCGGVSLIYEGEYICQS